MGVLQYHLVTTTPKLGKYKDQKVVSAKPINHGKISFEDFCKELADGSTVDQADVKAVLSRIAVVVPRLVERGYSVDAGDLGSFGVEAYGKMQATPELVNATTIKKPQIRYTPKTDMRKYAQSVPISVGSDSPRSAGIGSHTGHTIPSSGGGSPDSGGGSGTPGIRPGHNL